MYHVCETGDFIFISQTLYLNPIIHELCTTNKDIYERIWNFWANAVPWRNGEDVGLVYQASVVRAPPQEIFHSNSGIAVIQKAWNSALDYSKNIISIKYASTVTKICACGVILK